MKDIETQKHRVYTYRGIIPPPMEELGIEPRIFLSVNDDIIIGQAACQLDYNQPN